jgi:hypothetical protein
MNARLHVLIALPLFGALACSAKAGPSNAAHAATNDATRDPSAAGNKERVDLLLAAAPDLATAAAAAWAKDTGTAALSNLQKWTCPDAGFSVELGVPSLGLHGCTFTFGNGDGATTFTGDVFGYIVLKGQPDPTVPNDPVTHMEVPAAETHVQDTYATNFVVTGGNVPALPSPIALEDTRALEAYATKVAGITDTEDGGASLEDSLDACDEVDPAPIVVPNATFKCFTWLDDRYEGQTLIAFEVKDGKAVGVRWENSGGNF